MVIHNDWGYECNSGRSEMSLAANMQSRIRVWTEKGASDGELSGLYDRMKLIIYVSTSFFIYT